MARPADKDTIIGVLTRAFAADPPTRYIWPTADDYLDNFPNFVATFAGAAFAAGTAFIAADGAGAALWLAPDAASDIDAVTALINRTVQEGRRDEGAAVFAQMSRFHPREPHWHLPLIGTDPAAVRNGVGHALMTEGLALADQDGRPAYLENSNPANRAFYERFGFASVGVIGAGGYPPLFPMVRRPYAGASPAGQSPAAGLMRFYRTAASLARIQFDAAGDPTYCEVLTEQGVFKRQNDVMDDILNDPQTAEISEAQFHRRGDPPP